MTRWALGLVSLLAVTPAVAADGAMEDGLWEITTATEIPGLPAGAGNHTMRHCVKPGDSASPEKFAAGRDDGGCVLKDQQRNGNDYSFKMSCPRGMTVEGQYTFAPGSYTGATRMVTPAEGGEPAMTVTTKTSGKRLGPCK